MEREIEWRGRESAGYLYLINTWFFHVEISLYWFYKDHTFKIVLLHLKSHHYMYIVMLEFDFKVIRQSYILNYAENIFLSLY